ncbi:MAG: ribosome-binding factor A [Patescibacteria group bacterium]
MNSHKKERFASILQQKFNSVLVREFHVPGALLTVLNVSVSKDELDATIRIAIIPREKELEVFTELRRQEPYIRHAILKATRLRRVPKFHFQIVQDATNLEEKG